MTRPNTRSVAVSQGKGVTLAAAKASGLMESIEGFHAENIDAPLWLRSYEGLRRSVKVADVDRLAKSSIGSFEPHSKILWIEGRELLSEAATWVPYESVHTDYTLPFPTGSGAFFVSSNGLASGNHRLEAVSHGICEVIERDALTLWRCSSAASKLNARVDVGTINDQEILGLFEKLAAASVDYCIWDVTSDIGIPCFRCELADGEGQGFRRMVPIAGSGCHPRRDIALLRAITEAAQG